MMRLVSVSASAVISTTASSLAPFSASICSYIPTVPHALRTVCKPGPPYTGQYTGYFLVGSKFVGLRSKAFITKPSRVLTSMSSGLDVWKRAKLRAGSGLLVSKRISAPVDALLIRIWVGVVKSLHRSAK